MDEKYLEQAKALEERCLLGATRMVQERCAVKGLSHCEDCGDDIDLARRKAAPYSRRCVPCQQLFEKNEAMYGR